MEQQRESMEFDVVVVGAGPAGLSAAIRIKQRARETGRDISVCVIDKGAEIGAHVLSGAVIDPVALAELFPDWQAMGAPLTQPVTSDALVLLTEKRALRLPTPPAMHNRGCYVASLGNLTRWLGEQAETLGVEIFAGFAATEILFDESGRVTGIVTGDLGTHEDGQPGPNFEPGVELHARYTLFAEGCRGSLSEQVIAKFGLRDDCDEQTYGLGVKELWQVAPEQHKPGRVVHTVGWPLDSDVYGGAFLYHLDGGKVAVGLVVGLDYENPYLSPFDELQRFKTHPSVRGTFTGAKRIAYGARCLNEGGLQSIPRLTFPGGALIGAAAGFMNVPRVKGSHTAMKSAILAGDAVGNALNNEGPDELTAYPAALKKSWVWKELFKARNIRPAFRWGLWLGMAYAALDTYLFWGRAPWTLGHRGPDRGRLKRATKSLERPKPKADGVLTFDKPSSVYLSGTAHGENQPCHLVLKDLEVPVMRNLLLYDGPEARYCPAGVYEFIATAEGQQRLQINAANCLHCKACDIKDPVGNITWTPPEGGGGPQYSDM